MPDNYPQVSALLLAEVLDSLPARLRKKIDLTQSVDASDPGHSSGGTFVVQQGSGTVTFTAPTATTLADVSCDCLLAPRCLHLAQALLRCEVSTAPCSTSDGLDSASLSDFVVTPAGAAEAAGPLTSAQSDVLDRSLSAFVKLLGAGTAARDPLQLSAFLRLAHEAKTQRLYTLGAQCAAVCAMLSMQGTIARNAAVTTLTDAYRAAQQLAHRHAQGEVPASFLGKPRRSYTGRKALSLQGIFSEPIVAATGHAGVVTCLRDGEGALWSIHSNMPVLHGSVPTEQARQYYQRAPRLGGISTSHQELTRRSLLVSNVKASEDGRLSAGAQLAAVAGGVVEWDPLWFGAGAEDGIEFVRLEVRGLSGAALALARTDGRIVSAQPSSAASALGALDDLLELARHPGTELLCVLRRTVEGTELLAFSVDASQIQLPQTWHGRVMLGLDRLAPAYFRTPAQQAPQLPPVTAGPWPVLMQWLGRVAVHGRAALVNDKTALAADAARLRDANCVRGAQLLLEMQDAAHQSSRAFDGSLVYLPEPLPKAWLSLAVFAQAWLVTGA